MILRRKTAALLLRSGRFCPARCSPWDSPLG
jgi:hypothetical protein